MSLQIEASPQPRPPFDRLRALFLQRPEGTRFSHPPLRCGQTIPFAIFALPRYV